MVYSYQWQYPQEERPSRVRLADGFTRTAEAITDEMLVEAGWILAEDKPQPLDWHTVEWVQDQGWVQTPKPIKPYPSWVKNADETGWEAPTPVPDDGQPYVWDEDSLSWVVVTGWVMPAQP